MKPYYNGPNIFKMLLRRYISRNIAKGRYLMFIPLIGFSVLLLGRELCLYLGLIPWCDELIQHYPISKGFQYNYQTSKISFHGGKNEPINKFQLNYLHNPHHLCAIESIELLSVVKSSLPDFELRKVIRQTWGKSVQNDGGRMVFLLGSSTDVLLQQKVYDESSAFGDIIQGDFVDNYFNITPKTVMGIQWISEFCQASTYVFLVDDDVIVNFDNLLRFYRRKKATEIENLFSGHVWPNPGPKRIFTQKWFIPKTMYPFPCYPKFIAGAAILTSGVVVQKLNAVIPHVKHMQFDDAYLGIVAQIVGVIPVHNEDIDLFGEKVKGIKCLIASHSNEFRNPEVFVETFKYIKSSCTCI